MFLVVLAIEFVPVDLCARSETEAETDAEERAPDHLGVKPVLVTENYREGLKGKVENPEDKCSPEIEKESHAVKQEQFYGTL